MANATDGLPKWRKMHSYFQQWSENPAEGRKSLLNLGFNWHEAQEHTSAKSIKMMQ
jgi:hypothetical protein